MIYEVAVCKMSFVLKKKKKKKIKKIRLKKKRDDADFDERGNVVRWIPHHSYLIASPLPFSSTQRHHHGIWMSLM